MGGDLDKAMDADGSIRRRITAGSIVVVPLVLLLFPMDVVEKGFSKDVLGSTLFLVAVGGAMYAVGNILELFGELILLRIGANIIWATRTTWADYKGLRPPVVRILKTPVWLIVWYSRVYEGIFLGLVGRSRYELDIEKRLEPETCMWFRSLPTVVRDGLRKPYGDYFDGAWAYLRSKCPDLSHWFNRVETRNRDLLAYLAAFVALANLVSLPLFPTPRGSNLSIQHAVLIFANMTIFFGMVLFYFYFRLLSNSITVALQLTQPSNVSVATRSAAPATD